MFYAKSTNGFYIKEIHGDNIPDDAVDIDDNSYIELINTQSNGRHIGSDKNGYPILVDRQSISSEENKTFVRRERNRRVLCAIDAQLKYEREQESISRSISVSNPMLESDYVLVLQYMQDMFDIPQQSGFPWNGPDDPLCQWPEKPDCVRDTSIR